MQFHSKTKQEVLDLLSVSPVEGLTGEQVLRLREKYGENKLREKKKRSVISRFFDQFKDVMIIILLLAAAVSFAVVCVEKNWGPYLPWQRTSFYLPIV